MGERSGTEQELRQQFEGRFGRPPAFAVRAPGRVNLIGEHTDYSEGLVLPCAIEQALWLSAAPRSDGRFRIWSRESETDDGPVEFTRDALRRRGSWVDFPQGVVAAFRERGVEAGGLDVAICSALPRESGLSSSAALSVAVGLAIARAESLAMGAREIAGLAHRAESEFVGTPCGILDQFAVALAEPGHALRIDCRSESVESIPFAGRILIAQSGVARALAPGSEADGTRENAASGYRARVEQCERAVEQARAARIGPPGARTLRDFVPADLSALEQALDPLLLRRARHVISENDRVDAFCAVLRGGDVARLERVGAILAAGQQSLRDDFEVSTPELDHLCESASRLEGVYGSRLTGAGFGGSTLHLVESESADAIARDLAEAFEARFGRRPVILETGAGPGASVEPL